MSICLLSRTAIVAAYLIGLLLHGRADTVTGLLAVAIVAVWTTPLLRDGRIRRTASMAPVPPESHMRVR